MSSRWTSASTPTPTTTSATTTRIFQAIIARWNAAPDLAAFKQALGEAQHKLADDSVNGFLFQLPNPVVADAHLEGVWKAAPIFVNDLSALSWK